MRRMAVGIAAVIVLLPGSSFAQEWIQFASKSDLFGVNFPVEPKIEDITYKSEFGIGLPGHVYSADTKAGRFSVTVVDYADAEKIHTAKAGECRKNGGEGDACTNDWRS